MCFLNSMISLTRLHSEKAGELATTLENTKVELREEKTKVKNLADWKSQLADKNKELKEENSR